MKSAEGRRRKGTQRRQPHGNHIKTPPEYVDVDPSDLQIEENFIRHLRSIGVVEYKGRMLV
jgi:hypothetical protein